MKLSSAPRLSAIILSLSVAVPATAAAGGFATARFGGEAGHPASDHPTAIYYNPAGLSLGSGSRLYLEGLFAYRSASYDRPADAIDHPLDEGDAAVGTPSDAVDANAGKGTLSDTLVAPFAGAVSDFGIDNFGAGIAVYAPFGGQSSWDQNNDFADSDLYPGAVDGVQRWSIIEGSLRVVYFSGAASYTIPRARLSFGAGVNLVRTNIETVRGRTAAGTDDLTGPNGETLEGRSLINVEGLDLAASAGVIWQPVDELMVGASYQSQPGFGQQRLRGDLTNKFGTGPMDTSDIDLLQELPDIVRVGVRIRPAPAVELRVQGDYQRWSVLDKQCLVGLAETANCALTDTGALAPEGDSVIVNIPRNFRDTYGVRTGGSWWPQPNLELGASVAYDTNAVPDETIDASLMDMNKLIGNAGVRYGLTDVGLTLAANFLQVYYFDREVSPRARDEMGNPEAFSQPSRTPDGAGTYKQSVSVLTLAAEYAF